MKLKFVFKLNKRLVLRFTHLIERENHKDEVADDTEVDEVEDGEGEDEADGGVVGEEDGEEDKHPDEVAHGGHQPQEEEGAHLLDPTKDEEEVGEGEPGEEIEQRYELILPVSTNINLE